MNNNSNLKAWGPTVLRLAVGIVFTAHGWQKVHMGVHGVAGFLGSLNVPVPTISAVVLIAVEFLGGIALILGAATRWVALLIAFDMVVAILAVHLKNGFFMPTGFEFAFTLLAASISLALTGGGATSLDSAIRRPGMDK
jgi:putative oxidoreductase